VILFLNKKYKLIANVEFSNNAISSVSAEIPELVKVINIHKPSYAIIAHNHPSGNVLPSAQDDFTTKKLNVIFDLHDVNLFDHIIVSGNKAYSYNQEKRIEETKKATLNKLFEEIQ
jgi:DNA repair protein RadC